MIEIKGDIFEIFSSLEYDAICITTNGIVKSDGSAVMGAGIALQAKKYFKGIENRLGKRLIKSGNNVYHLGNIQGHGVISFPTKNHWKDDSDIKLIEKSAKELMELVNKMNYKKVLITRVGCGNGNLNWDEVKKIVNKYFDDRIYVIDKEN